MLTNKRNLIVYFPGYTGLPKSKFNPLLRKFRRDGFTTYSVKYNLFGREDITKIAKQAIKQIQKLNLSHYDSVTFIGHSMGGLVARKVLSLDPHAADYLITLGSPHKGVQAASRPFAWLGGHSVLQMREGSTFSKYLGVYMQPTLTITGKYDYLVPDASIEETMFDLKMKPLWTNLKVPTTHIGLITGFRTYGEIYSWLVYEQLSTLDPAKVNLATTYQPFTN